MQNKKLFLKTSILLCLWLLCAPDAAAAVKTPKQDLPVIIAFTRHTFRGVSQVTPPAALTIGNLKINNPVLSYGMDATAGGLKITTAFAKTAYNDGAKLALKAIHQNPNLAGHWSIIRADLATQRTFATAVALSQGLPKVSHQDLTLVGCPTQINQPVDVMTTWSKTLAACMRQQKADQNSHPLEKPLAKKYIMLANHLLSLLGGEPIINQSNLKQSIAPITQLCNRIEMSSDLGSFPLQYVLLNHPALSARKNHEAVVIALQLLGYDLLIKNSHLENEALVLKKLEAIDALQNGEQEIIVTHDTKISALLSQLGFISAQSKPNALAVYPLETITIALDQQRAAVVRTRINIGKAGAMNGQAGYQSRVLWSGTRKDWDARMMALRQKIERHRSIAHCIQQLPICQPVVLKLNP